MASYDQIYNLRYASSVLRNRVTVATIMAARAIIAEVITTTNHDNRVIWAKQAIKDAPGKAEQILWGLTTHATIQDTGEATTDAALQTAVDQLINFFADGSA